MRCAGWPVGCPGMSESYSRGGWSGLFTVTPDWHPILDRVPGVEGLFCTVGFSGHGFKLAPAIGQAMAELVLQGKAESVDLTPLAVQPVCRRRLALFTLPLPGVGLTQGGVAGAGTTYLG